MFSLFGKGKGKGDDHSKEDMFSSAAATALAAAEGSSAPAAAPSTGRHLHGAEVAIDLDDLRPSEVVFELKVQPITLVKTDFKLEQTQLVAVSDTYICYGLKAGHIRALDRNTGGRALFKGHPAGVSSMALFSPGNNLLASVSKQGDIAVRHISEKAATDGDDATIQGSLIMSAQLPAADLKGPADGPFAPVNLAWHPTVPQILAAGAGSSVHIFEVPTAFEGTSAPPPSQPGITYSIAGGSSAVITTVAFTPSGDLLVAGDSAGGVHAWWLEGEEASEAPLFSWQPFGGAAATGAGGRGIGSVRVLHQVGHGPSLLLTGNANNSTVKLWALPAAAAGGAGSHQPQHLQTVSFRGKQGSGAVFCHVAVQSDLQLVVLADTGRKQVYTLHYSLGSSGSNGATASAAAFDYASFFSVKQPILSLSTIPEAADAAAEQQLLLYCVQTDAIQQYMLNTSLCTASPGQEEEVAAPAASAAAASKAPISPTAAAAGAAAAGSEVPPPAQLPTPTLLGARAASQKAPSTEAVASPAKSVEPATPAATGAHAHAHAQEQHQQQLQELQAVSSDGSTTADDSRAAPLPPMPTSSLMHSAEKAPPATPTAAGQQASPAPQPFKTEPAGSRDAAPPAVATPAGARVAAAASAAAAAAASAGAASAPAPASAAPGAGVPSAEVAALQEQMVQLLQLQERMAAQLQASSQQTVTGVKAELGRSLKSTEGSLLKQFEAALKSSAKKAEDERRKAAAKERQELEKIMAEQINQVSALLQRDLSKVAVDTAREQARAAVNTTVNAVTPAVASAVAASLQQELASAAGAGGSLQAALEQSLSSSLAGPLHEALRSNFDASLIPAFERATRVMFNQVEAAFNSWLTDSSKAVSAAQADAASSLNSALSQLQSVVSTMRTDLADTSRSLNRLASSTASRAPAGTQPAAAAPAGAGVSAGGRMSGAGAAAPQQDPRVEIGALLANRQLETALVKALNTASLDVLLWTCKQIDPAQVLGGASMNMSQTTLLSLVHQLSANLSSDADTPLKLAWLAEAAPAVDPHDPVTEPHLRTVVSGVMNNVKQLVMALPQTDAMAKQGKITLHLFNSLLHQ